MKRTQIKPVSKKRAALMPEYHALVDRLRELSGNKSELDGASPDWQTDYLTESHHISGRIGKLYLDPFNLIMITRNQHKIIGLANNYEAKQALLDFIRPIRIEQGFKEG